MAGFSARIQRSEPRKIKLSDAKHLTIRQKLIAMAAIRHTAVLKKNEERKQPSQNRDVFIGYKEQIGNVVEAEELELRRIADSKSAVCHHQLHHRGHLLVDHCNELHTMSEEMKRRQTCVVPTCHTLTQPSSDAEMTRSSEPELDQ